jgi:hypothetical protein
VQPSRTLSRQWLEQRRGSHTEVTVRSGWLDRLRDLLAREDRIVIIGGPADRTEIARAVQTLLTEPFERDYLLVWPILSGVYRSGETWRIQVELRNMGVQ